MTFKYEVQVEVQGRCGASGQGCSFQSTDANRGLYQPRGQAASPLFISSSAIALPHLDGSDLENKLEGRDR